MDKRDFFIENMDIIEFLNDKGYDKIDYTDPSGLTWTQVIELMSEYYDTQYEKYPDVDPDYVD